MSKNIVRVNKNNNYTVMSNYHLRDERLSWKAKGIHSYVLSLPDDWKIILSHLETISTDGEKSLRSGLKELYDLKYWQKYPVYIDGKVEQWVTEIYEEPFDDKEKIKSVIVKNDKKIINYENDEIDVEIEKKNLLPQKGKVDKSVDNTDVDLLPQKVQVGYVEVEKVEVEKEGLLNTNTTKDLSFTNHSINKERLTEDKDPLELLSKDYDSETITLALEKANNAKNNGTKINNLYAYLNKLCFEIEKENKILGSAKNNRNKTKFHNFTGRTENYTSEELENVAKRKRQEYINSIRA